MASQPNDIIIPKHGRYPLFPFNEDQADEICCRLAQGESLLGICRDEHMPDVRSVYYWRRLSPDFARAYAQAREDQGDTNADEINDVRKQIADGTMDPAAGRVIIDALKWEAGRRKSKVYGDSTQLRLADANGEVLKSNFDPSHLSPEERDALRSLVVTAQQRALAPPQSPEDAEYEELDDGE